MNTGSTQEENFKPNFDIGEFAAMDDERFAPQSATLRTGATGNYEEEQQLAVGDNPDATRWAFNPYAIVDLRNLPHGSGFPYLENVIFNRIRSIKTNEAKSIDETGNAAPPMPGQHLSHSNDHYNKIDRSSYMIARELVERYGDKGVIIIPELTGMDDEAGEINKMLFGDDVPAVEDVNEEDRPVPVLPNLLESLRANVNKTLEKYRFDSDEDRALFLDVAEKCRQSIRAGMRHARITIDEAQKRFLDEKNPNRYFSEKEKRAYLALGLEVPNQMPLVTASQAAGMGGAGVSGQAIADAVVAGVTTAMGVAAPAPATAVESPSDFADVKALESLEAEADKPIAKEKAKPAKIATGAKKNVSAE